MINKLDAGEGDFFDKLNIYTMILDNKL